MKRHLILLLCFVTLASVAKAATNSVAIAELACSSKGRTFVLKYAYENDDFDSAPNLPKHCSLGTATYKVAGQRGAFRESGLCGAQPPVSISVFRNGKPLIVDTIFGDNCFHGPSISSVEITEVEGKAKEIRLCFSKRVMANMLVRNSRSWVKEFVLSFQYASQHSMALCQAMSISL